MWILFLRAKTEEPLPNIFIKFTNLQGKSVFTLIKKKLKFPHILDRVQSHVWLTTSSYIVKIFVNFLIIRKPFLIYDFAPDPIRISYEENFVFFFISVLYKEFFSWNYFIQHWFFCAHPIPLCRRMTGLNQCCGSVTFWYRSESADP